MRTIKALIVTGVLGFVLYAAYFFMVDNHIIGR